MALTPFLRYFMFVMEKTSEMSHANFISGNISASHRFILDRLQNETRGQPAGALSDIKTLGAKRKFC